MYPTFAVLSGVFYYTTHKSIQVIDEIYLNNIRANLLFNDYFASGKKSFKDFEEVNERELYFIPNFFNR